MAASMARNSMQFSSKLSAIVTGIIKLNYSRSSNLVLRVCGVRFCSSFKSKLALVDGQDQETGSQNEIGQELPEKEVPKWKLTRQALAKRYAQEGAASGINPCIIWPTRKELENIIKDEEEWCPSLEEMHSEISAENRDRELRILKREKLIDANMAKMPQMVAEYRKKMAEKREVTRQQRAKRSRLLEEAKDKLGYAIDPRSTRFQKMMTEIEREERKKKKELKKKGIVM